MLLNKRSIKKTNWWIVLMFFSCREGDWGDPFLSCLFYQTESMMQVYADNSEGSFTDVANFITCKQNIKHSFKFKHSSNTMPSTSTCTLVGKKPQNHLFQKAKHPPHCTFVRFQASLISNPTGGTPGLEQTQKSAHPSWPGNAFMIPKEELGSVAMKRNVLFYHLDFKLVFL